MVFFNYSTMQMAAKVVYYGPGLCGKTTNLQFIYGHTSQESRGEMVSLETETDRTLFFDLLPIDVGSIHGFNTRIQLYTVPGQVFYNTTRKLVLKGVDGIVFVADSQRPMLQANIDSLHNLEENLAEMQLTFDTVPVVLQYNKRDLPDILTVDELNRAMNTRGWEHYEACAVTGAGVFETLKGISRQTLINLKRRLAKMGSESRPAAARPAAPPSAPPGAGARAAAAVPVPSTPNPGRLAAAGAAAHPAAAPKLAGAPPAARHRSQIDVLAELELIRKQAMRPAGFAPSAPPPAPSPLPRPLTARSDGRGEIHRSIDMALKRADFSRARRFTFSLRVEDGDSRVVDTIRDFPVDIKDVAGLEKILLHLNIAVHSKE